MQYLATKLRFSFGVDKSQAYSPFAAHIDDIQNKRSRLFPDRKRIPGRAAKFCIVIAYLFHIYGVMKLVNIKRIATAKAEHRRQQNRKIAPCFQSIEDIQFLRQKHRFDLILIEAFKEKGGQAYLESKKRFHNTKIWAPANTGGFIMAGEGTGRYANSLFENYMGKFFS